MVNWEQQFKQASKRPQHFEPGEGGKVTFGGEGGGFSWVLMIGTAAAFIFGIEALRWKGKKARR